MPTQWFDGVHYDEELFEAWRDDDEGMTYEDWFRSGWTAPRSIDDVDDDQDQDDSPPHP